jgi:hypothetical protein
MNWERIKELEEKYLAEHPGTANTIVPYVFKCAADVLTCQQFPFPAATEMMLSEKWEYAEQTWFVDSWGVGKSGSALSTNAFRRELAVYVAANRKHGFVISGVGQFQVYIQACRRISAYRRSHGLVSHK